MLEFSVLMSVYYKEKASYLKESLDSILLQTVRPSEIVIVKDGPLTEELDIVIAEYEQKNKGLFKIVPLAQNVGLGLALAEGVKHCNNSLIARMDTDDIAREDRFALQISEFEKDGKLDICGSHIIEFESTKENVVARRTVPLIDVDIKKYQKRRDGFNHVTVMFKKETVLRAGNYQSCLLMEDTLLWANMFNVGAVAKNIDDYLVFVRVGADMFERRGGWSYFKKYRDGRKKVRETGFISYWDYIYTILVQFVVALLPNKLRAWLFKKLLHK